MSEILLRQASSTTDPAVAYPLLIFVGLVTIARIALVRVGRPARLLNALLVVVFLVVFLRDPGVQSVLASVGLNLASTRALGHMIIMYGAAVAWLLARSWGTSRRFHPIELWLTFGTATVLAGWIWWVSGPARAANIAVEDHESWRTAGYLVAVSLPVPIACSALIVAAIAHGTEDRSWRALPVVVATVVAGGLQWIDHVSRAVSGVMLSTGTHTWLTDLRTQGVDQIFLPAVAALALCTVPSVWSAARERRSVRVQIRDLEPLWGVLTGSISGISKPSTGDLAGTDRLEEIYIEIEDGLIRLPLGDSSTPEGRATDVRAALELHHAGGGETPAPVPAWVSDRAAVREAARAFSQRSTAVIASV